jgi:DNA-binding CsgD family transcriptional regulator
VAAHRITDHRHDRLSVGDVRALLRLCNELHAAAAAGHDPEARKRRLVEGVRDLTTADHAAATVAAFGAGAVPAVISSVRAGGADGDASADGAACAWDVYRRLRRSGRSVSAASPTAGGKPGAEWCTAEPGPRARTRGRPSAGPAVHSLLPLGDGRVVACLTVEREPGLPGFTRRERAMVCALHAEAGWLYRPDVMRVSSESRALSRRQLETLQHLLAGKGEKQIAAEMKVRYNTVHHYVKALYRHFRVTSRSELLARWVGK